MWSYILTDLLNFIKFLQKEEFARNTSSKEFLKNQSSAYAFKEAAWITYVCFVSLMTLGAWMLGETL